MPVSQRSGVEIYYEKVGSGPPLVLIHAMPFDHHVWLYQVERFSSRFTTLAMDLRGWGVSAKPHERFSLEDMGRDVTGVLHDAGFEGDAIVMGCSVGSKIALILACDHPDIYKAAVLVGGNSGLQAQFDHRIAAYRAEHAAGRLPAYHLGHLRHGVTPTWAETSIGQYLLRGFVERGRDLDPESIVSVFHAVGESDLTPRLASYRSPTLIVNGQHDNALKGGTRTAGLIPQSEHFILPDAGHCCFIERPDIFNARVATFFTEHELW